jgi:hypothetical protein
MRGTALLESANQWCRLIVFRIVPGEDYQERFAGKSLGAGFDAPI